MLRRRVVQLRNRLLGIRQLENRIQALREDVLEVARGGAFCPMCGRSSPGFRPGPNGRPEARCPECGSLERHRALWLFLHRETDVFRRRQSFLHFAPERWLTESLKRAADLDYLSADLQPDLADVQADLHDLPFEDGRWDTLLASHVLEHVPDDRRAMSELFRVLRPGGVAVVNVPWREIPVTDEDPSVTDPEERRRRWGQADHLRAYGADLVERLEGAGFDVKRVDVGAELPDSVRVLFRLPAEPIFRCHKPGWSPPRA